MNPKVQVNKDKWFENITGCNEEEFRKLIKENCAPIYETDNKLYIENIKDKKRRIAGNFKLESLIQLREKALTKKPVNRPKFEIIYAESHSSIKFVDISYLQSLPENKGALFQVASNFNAIEAISDNSNPEDKDFVSGYIYDRTQGPIASISGGAAAITRVYAAFYDSEKPQTQWGQTKDNQINFLNNLREYFPINNGYVFLNGNEKPLPEFSEHLLDNVVVAYHEDVQVTTGPCVASNYELINDNNQTVDQVFCAALNVAQGDTGKMNYKINGSEEKQKFLLQAAYQGAYVAAIAHNKKKLFLSLLGGGVFGNSIGLILDAIADAHQKWGYYIEHVVLNIFFEAPYPDLLRRFEEKRIKVKITGYDEK